MAPHRPRGTWLASPAFMAEAQESGLTQEEMRETVVRLAFGGDPARLEQFCDIVREALPRSTAAPSRDSGGRTARPSMPTDLAPAIST